MRRTQCSNQHTYLGVFAKILPIQLMIRYNSSTSRQYSRIGILGGGLAGLTSAYYLSKRLPSSNQIILWEKQNRLGGWVHSFNIKGDEKNSFLVESGPRSVRPKGLAGLISIQLIKDLNLLDQVIVIPKDHPSAQNRYIYTNNGLQKLPSSILTLMKSIHRRPVSLLPRSILKDLMSSNSGNLTHEDESIEDFISRRFGKEIGEELISGMVHGIYAGDYKELSVRSTLFKPIWELERKFGGVLNGFRISSSQQPTLSVEEEKIRDDQSLQHLINSSVWGLKGGLQTLIDALINWLQQQPNVILKSAESVESITISSFGPSKVTTSLQVYDQFDHLLSALPPQVLHSCLESSLQDQFSVLKINPSVTVGVVNLCYRSPKRINPIPPAFGYLIPASISPELNPHKVLGVVFDSDMMPIDEEKIQGEELTKLTVMMGGHHYSKHPNSIPTIEHLSQQASQTIKNHLGISQDPFFVQAQLQKDCIPQYLVGHHQRMIALHTLLGDLDLSLVGSGYAGVGINDVIKSSAENAHNLLHFGRSTGLESFQTFKN